MRSVAVFGASGHAGSALIERLRNRPDWDVRPIIHTSGNAWGLARYGLRLWMADLTSKDQIRRAIGDCRCVVNCTFPPTGLMPATTRNLTAVCREMGVVRYVHLSSLAVYGEHPAPESVHEDAPPCVRKGTYGWFKLQQDDIVLRAHEKGLPCVVLCPPNITGPNSRYLLQITDQLREGRLPLVGDGRVPCVLVDAANLAAAAELALLCDAPDGRRIFVTDDADVTWSDVIESLRGLAEVPRPPSISVDQAHTLAEPPQDLSLIQGIQRIFRMPESRAILKKSRFARSAYGGLIRVLPGFLGDRLRGRRRAAGGAGPGVDARLVSHQLRAVRHSCQRAKDRLGYRPVISGPGSLEAFCTWYRRSHAQDQEDWTLLRELYSHPV